MPSKSTASKRKAKSPPKDSLTLKDFMPSKAKISDKLSSPHINMDARTRAEAKADRAGSQHRQTQNTGETGGPQGLEPTRYGDWERAGRCIDF